MRFETGEDCWATQDPCLVSRLTRETLGRRCLGEGDVEGRVRQMSTRRCLARLPTWRDWLQAAAVTASRKGRPCTMMDEAGIYGPGPSQRR